LTRPKTYSKEDWDCPIERSSTGQRANSSPHSLNLPNSLAHPLSLDHMSKIHIPTPLRQYVDKQSTIDVKAKTVAEALDALVAEHPDLRRHLYTEDGKLRAFVNLYVNDEDIRYLQKEATALSEGDSLSIVPSIAGGVV
jgi:sulfur-carrier protein